MNNVPSESDARYRRRVTNAIGDGLRNLRAELSLLNHHVGSRVDLKDGDLEILDLLDRHGTLSPSALAKRAGVHPATITGILDRLERGGWITRDRDATDRRAVVIRSTRHRIREMFRLYSGMSARVDEICASFDLKDLDVIADFLHRVAEAGRESANELGQT